MAVTTTTAPTVFDIRFYQSLADMVVKGISEDPDINWLPTKVAELDAHEFKQPIYTTSQGVHGGTQYSLGSKMETAKSYKVFNLGTVQADLYYDINDMARERQYLVQQKAQELREWQFQAKVSIFRGVNSLGYTHMTAGSTQVAGLGIAINEGLLDTTYNATSNGLPDPSIDSADDIYNGLTDIAFGAPFALRQGRTIKMGCTSNFWRKAHAYKYTNVEESGLSRFLTEFCTKDSPLGYRVDPNFVISDDLFLVTTDVQGTTDRLVSFIPDLDCCAKVFSRGISMLGEVGNSIGGVTQSWGTKLGGCGFIKTATQVSDAITWA
jgi:hypothetical protein